LTICSTGVSIGISIYWLSIEVNSAVDGIDGIDGVDAVDGVDGSVGGVSTPSTAGVYLLLTPSKAHWALIPGGVSTPSIALVKSAIDGRGKE
jgi:hypothetical protein